MSQTVAGADSSLASLELGPGEMMPSFWGGRSNFMITVPHAVEAVRIKAAATDQHASLTLDGESLEGHVLERDLPVAVGRTAFSIAVTSADRTATTTYLVKVHRGIARPNWERVLEHTPFADRDSQGEAVFNDRMWILGGYTPEVVGDVWSSGDGVAWRSEGEVPAQGGVNIPVCLVHAGKMWTTGMDGGWYATADGRQWEKMPTPPWMPRADAGHTVFKGKMWVAGGGRDGLLNDVWSSENGVDWTLELEAAPWPPRHVFSNLVVMGDRMWLIGGGIQGYQPFRGYRDVWSTSDGIHWECATDHAPWPGRIWTSCAAYADRLWLVGGFRAQPSWQNFDDVWYSADGRTWSQLVTDDIWSPRHEKSLLVFQDALWLIAGNAWPLMNDVWRLRIDGMTFVSQPVLEEWVGTQHRYEAKADFHPSGDAVTYELDGPQWLSINQDTGVVTGRCQAAGEHKVTIKATAQPGETAEQTYLLTVMDW